MTTTVEQSADFRVMLADESPEVIARSKVIGEQNDQFRGTWGADFTVPGQIFMTNGVTALSNGWQVQIMTTVMKFDDFTEDNDPYLQRDFGAFTLTIDGNTERFFWKIDLYDRNYQHGSDDSANTDVTRRVLTIMLTSEY